MLGSARPQIVLICDPGPDPDDVKALLVAATMHARRQGITLRAVICNGGGQPIERAKLARCVLNHIGSHDVPVGYGSEGTAYTAQPHEYDIEGFDSAQTCKHIQPGTPLLLNTLRRASPKSVVLVCISSLRDAADMCREHEKLVLRKVREVAVQGGLERDEASGEWKPDSSVNNGFDMDGARELYAFCFRHALSLAVVSRNAVPLLPMQLAASFAVRTLCPVMSYLANAQSLGLEGLWQKLCEGKLPPRCTKQWYFETFCGVDKDEFERTRLELLDGSTPIRARLNGYVKPYDVLALMTVLPSTRALFGAGVPAGDGVPFPERHRLLLRPEDTVNVSHVLKLLRDTYHGVVLSTRASVTRSALARGACLSEGGGGDDGPRGADAAPLPRGLSSVQIDIARRKSQPVSESYGAEKERLSEPARSSKAFSSWSRQSARDSSSCLRHLSSDSTQCAPSTASGHCRSKGALQRASAVSAPLIGSSPLAAQGGRADPSGLAAARASAANASSSPALSSVTHSTRLSALDRTPNATLARLAVSESLPGSSPHPSAKRNLAIVQPLSASASPQCAPRSSPGPLAQPHKRGKLPLPLGSASRPKHDDSGSWPVSMQSGSGGHRGFFARARKSRSEGSENAEEEAGGVLPEADIVLLLERAHRQALAWRNLVGLIAHCLGSALMLAGVLLVTIPLSNDAVHDTDSHLSTCMSAGLGSSSRHCALIELTVDAHGRRIMGYAVAYAGALINLLGLQPIWAERERIFVVDAIVSFIHIVSVAVCAATIALTTTETWEGKSESETRAMLAQLGVVLATALLAFVLNVCALRYRLHSFGFSMYDGGERHALFLLWASVATSAVGRGVMRAMQFSRSSKSLGSQAVLMIDVGISLLMTVFALTPALQRSLYSLFARFSWSRGAYAPLAVLSGFGTKDERTPAALVREALQCFVPVRLSGRALRALTFEAREMAETEQPGKWISRRAAKRSSLGSAARRALMRREVEATLSPEELSVSAGVDGNGRVMREGSSLARRSTPTQVSRWFSGGQHSSTITPAPLVLARADGPSAALGDSRDGRAVSVHGLARGISGAMATVEREQRAHSEGHAASNARARAYVPMQRSLSNSNNRCSPCGTEASALGRLLQAPVALLQRGTGASFGVCAGAQAAAAAHADFFIVHSWHDSASDKVRVLSEWSKQWAREHGRAPVVWLDALCADPLLLQREALQHITVYMGRCRRLLLLCGPSLTERLWCIAECYAWRASGGQLDNVDVLLVCPDGLSVAQRAAEWQTIASAFDAFHVMWADAEVPQVRALVSAAIALATVSGVNEVVRSFMPVVQRAAKADLDALRALERTEERGDDDSCSRARDTTSYS